MTARRPHIPLSVKLHSALLALGFTDEEINSGGIEWDHAPSLALRVVDPETGELVPHPNDPHYLRPLSKAKHRTKTSGRKGEKRSTSYGSDAHAIAKARRLEKAHQEHEQAMEAKAEGEPAKRKGSIQSRPFQKGRKQKIPSKPLSRRKESVK